MKSLNRIIFVIVAVCGLFLMPSMTYSAENPINSICTGEAGKSQFCKDAKQDANKSITSGQNGILYKIAQTIVLLTGAISVIMIIIGGFKYVMSNGDSGSVKSAKDTIMYALIGLLVAIFAQTIVSFVLSRFL